MEFSKEIALGKRRIGSGNPCFVVAEIGINHNGDVNLARKEIDAAAEAGADSVKFQNYRTEDFIADRNLTYAYENNGKKIVESQYDMFKRCELDYEMLADLKAYCDKKSVVFHSTPTGMDGLADLLKLGTAVLKNGSDYLQHTPLIRAMGESGLPTALSTGMATKAEIETAVNTFCSTGNKSLILLHCVSLYPTPPENVNLKRMVSLRRAFNFPVGFSDHTSGNQAAIGAVALGACWIEKHFTLDRTLPGPDHRFSSDAIEFRELVNAIRVVEKQLGSADIEFTAEESSARQQFRLSCVASRNMPAGWILKENDIVFRRPGRGFPPGRVCELYGRQLRRNVNAGDLLCEENLESIKNHHVQEGERVL